MVLCKIISPVFTTVAVATTLLRSSVLLETSSLGYDVIAELFVSDLSAEFTFLTITLTVIQIAAIQTTNTAAVTDRKILRRIIAFCLLVLSFILDHLYINKQNNSGKKTAGTIFITLMFVIFNILSAIAIISSEPITEMCDTT